MAKFRYLATTETGTKARGVATATSLKTAMAGLVEQGFTVSQLKPKRNVLKFEITKEKLPQGELMHFSRQLSAFVRAGIPLIEALEVIEEEADDKTLRMVLQGVRESLITGETFSEALRPYETLFPKFYVDMVRAAELTGSLDDVLSELSGYIKRDLEARNKIKSALVYPLVILVMAIGTVIVLSTFVLPRFKTFFQGFHATLPLPTRMLISFTDFVSNDWLYIIAVLFLIVAIPMALVRTRRGRRAKDRLLLRLPILGEVMLFAIVERFCRLLATMMQAGVPLPEAMGVLGDATKNVVFQEGLANVHGAMMRGEGLARPMSDTKLFPGAVIQMIKVGENTGTLNEQLSVGSEYYGEELEYKIQRLTSLFEPAVIIFMGLAVGFVAVALISAMYGIYKQVQV
ncbi:MAG TPA: type II secretion system F family protein [Actinomycetota bacterium]|jgi:type IV pilus assembly protein PilC|nr:type II secretion system F family protein [Actinomycetota bacterium]